MKKQHILIIILLISAILTLFGLSRGDTVNDEVFTSFRGLGMIDFDEANTQTTPWEWTDPEIPWWAHLSFHDHPIGVPLIQNLSMRMFGDNNFGFRLPSAILGIISVYLLYLIGKFLYSENIGLFSAAIFGLTVNHLYISRVGMQEAYVIFIILLAIYFFIKSLQNPKYLIAVGIIIGLGLLIKYTVFILVLIFLTYLLFFKRQYFKNKNFWAAIILAILIFSPSIIYNLTLYKNFGHFDFQICHILNKCPEAWKNAPGKEIGTPLERIQNFIPRLINSNSWIFLTLAFFSLIAFLVSLFKNTKENLIKNNLLLFIICYLLLLLILIGPSYRFLTMLTPFLALSIGLFLQSLLQKLSAQELASKRYPNILKYVGVLFKGNVLLSFILVFEIFYSVNNQIAFYPVGPTPWLASNIRYENYNWGYNELNQWLESETKNKIPALTFDMKYQFLERIKSETLEKGLANNAEVYPALFVYDGNFDQAGKLWSLDRFHIYHAWPIINLKTYYENLEKEGFDYYRRSGFKYIYFVFLNNAIPTEADKSLMQGNPLIIKNQRGDNVFNIYKFNIYD